MCYGKRSITHENTTKIDQHFPRSISSIDFTCEIIHFFFIRFFLKCVSATYVKGFDRDNSLAKFKMELTILCFGPNSLIPSTN